jgi:hypothetical protein
VRATSAIRVRECRWREAGRGGLRGRDGHRECEQAEDEGREREGAHRAMLATAREESSAEHRTVSAFCASRLRGRQPSVGAPRMKKNLPFTVGALLVFASFVCAAEPRAPLAIATPMAAPEWAKLQRQLLAEHLPACREFYQKYYDARGYLQCFVRWGANDGPDDAFENFNGWPELHALGADDEILRLFLAGHEGMIKQYTEAKTVETPIARQGMYYKEFIVQSDWMHHGEGLQLFNRMPLSLGANNALYGTRARRFAGLYMGEDPEAPNYDPKLKLIRSMQNGSRGPMLRKATALDWVGDSFDVSQFVALHGEKTYAQFLAHYE